MELGTYIPFTEEQKLRAGAVDLEEFLRQRGETLIRSGRDKRMESDHSVTVRGNEWYDHADGVGGNPISFVERQYGLCYSEAMKLLLGGDNGDDPGTGVEEPAEKIAGDVNGDGKVNSKDLTRFLKYLAGNNVEVVEEALDVTGDGSVNTKDLIRLLKFLSGEIVDLG